ncbi:MAG: SRPBCC family protein [Bdellovibrionales bacterium]|nr:SRPBCC family protein [Bdellovibrionales bacterium]
MERIDDKSSAIDVAPPAGRTGIHPDLDEGIRHEAAIVIMRPADEVYQFWRQLENLPRFMWRLENISVNSDTLSHWTYKALKDTVRVEWDSVIVQDEPGKSLSWKSVDGSTVSHAGTVTFEEQPFQRGTIVRIELSYNPPGGRLTDFVQRVLGESPQTMLKEDLRRLRWLMETGVVPTTEGQPHGERGITDALNPALHHH